jgi:hypothetical protein
MRHHPRGAAYRLCLGDTTAPRVPALRRVDRAGSLARRARAPQDDLAAVLKRAYVNRADFLLSSAAVLLAQNLPSGRTLLQPFASAPYPHASRENGHVYQGKLYDAATHYSDSTVAIYIPAGYRDTGSLDFIVHFHGWNNNVQHVLERYRLREQLDASGRNAILVVPQGPKDAPDSGDGKLELDPGGFARFMSEVASWVHANGKTSSDRIGRIVLTAHSGGYGGAGGVLTRGGMNDAITDVILFDAAYAYFDAFANWTKARPSNHFLSVFTYDTSTGNTAIMGLVQAAQPNIYVRLGDTLTGQQLETRAPTFALTTSIAHDDLLTAQNWYALFLRSTALSANSV